MFPNSKRLKMEKRRRYLKRFTFFVALSMLIAIGFAVMAAEPKPTALPAGGGEPGKAYMGYCKAIASGDMAALKKLVTADQVKSMDDPTFAKMFPMMQSMHAKDIKITGGTMTATAATLNAEGKDSGGAVAKGTISMVLEDKLWKVKEDSWKSEMK
jgi:hypothetical protein